MTDDKGLQLSPQYNFSALSQSKSRLLVVKRGITDIASLEFEMALKFRRGDGVVLDRVEAAKWFSRAAKRGYGPAQRWLGSMLLKGDGIPQDLDEAVRLIKLAAAQGESLAQAYLGVIYQNGNGVPKSAELSKYWFRMANQSSTEKRRKSDAR